MAGIANNSARAAVHAADAATLVDVTARLSSNPGKPSRDLKALREAIISEIDRKNAQDVIRTMEKLDAAASTPGGAA
jgi:carbon monoxide dehydrogenase subunit G